MLLSNGKRYIHTKATSNTQLILEQAQTLIFKSCCYTEFAFEVVMNEENHLGGIIIIPRSKTEGKEEIQIYCCLCYQDNHTAIKKPNKYIYLIPRAIIIL